MGFISREPRIEGAERQECLAYLEEEMKLGLFRVKVDSLADEGMMRYGQLAQKDKAKAFEGMVKVTNHISQAATELVRRKHEMTFIPDAALATSSAWETVYLDYKTLATSEATTMEADVHGMATDWEHVQRLVKEVKKAIGKAQREDKRLLKRLKLTGDEARGIVDNASRVTEADDWLLKLGKLLNRRE